MPADTITAAVVRGDAPYSWIRDAGHRLRAIRRSLKPFLPILEVLEPNFLKRIVVEGVWEEFRLYGYVQSAMRWKKVLDYLLPGHNRKLDTLELYHRQFLWLSLTFLDRADRGQAASYLIVYIFDHVYSLSSHDSVDQDTLKHLKHALELRLVYCYHSALPASKARGLERAGEKIPLDVDKILWLGNLVDLSWRACQWLPLTSEPLCHLVVANFGGSDCLTVCPLKAFQQENESDNQERLDHQEEVEKCCCTLVSGWFSSKLFKSLNVDISHAEYSRVIHEFLHVFNSQRWMN